MTKDIITNLEVIKQSVAWADKYEKDSLILSEISDKSRVGLGDLPGVTDGVEDDASQGKEAVTDGV